MYDILKLKGSENFASCKGDNKKKSQDLFMPRVTHLDDHMKKKYKVLILGNRIAEHFFK